jgi:antigen 43
MTSFTVSSGFTLSGTTLLSGATSVGTINLSPGDTLIVANGGTAEALTVTSETVTVSNGGTTSNLVISNGGSETLAPTGKSVNTSVFNGGVITEGGTTPSDIGLFIGSGGLLDLIGAFGSQASPVTVASGAMVEFGGVATSGTVTSASTASTTTISVGIAGGPNESVVFAGGGLTFTSGTVGSGTAARDVFTATCFAAGTKILGAGHEVAVEAVHPGDLVAVLRGGGTALEPVIWVGKSSVDLHRHPRPELAAPVRVKAGALADNTPTRDLVLSPEHCLVLEGRCIPVKLLINGGSITQEFPAEPFEYFHLELARHGSLTAEGAAAESYLDTGNRSSFDNADIPRQLHPTFAVNATAERWSTDACAPLAKVPDEVAPVWQALAARSVELGYEIRAPAMTEDPDLHMLADGRRIQPISDRNSRYVFMVPAGARSVTLASRFGIPAAKMVAGQRDTRRLGVSVDWIAIRSSANETILAADNPALQDGWNDAEQSGARLWRWTDGAATVPWESITGAAVMTVQCTLVDQYLVQADNIALVA